jgi:hypothetical protein
MLHKDTVELLISNSINNEISIYVLLNALPYVGQRLKLENSEFIENIVKRLNDLFSKRQKSDTLAFKTNDDYLVRLWNTNLNNLNNINSSFRLVFKDKPVTIKDKFDIKDSIFVQVKPMIHINSYIELFEEGNYNILNNLDQLILADHIEDIVIAFQDKLKFSIDFLENINNFFGTDKNINYLIVEVIMNMILRLNNDRNIIIYYSMLLIKLVHNNDLKSLLQDALDNKICNNLSDLDIECIENLTTFLSLYISNNEFTYDYSKLTQLNNETKPHYFFKCFIDKLTGLGTKERVKGLLDKSLHQFLPDEDIAKKK